MQVQVFGNISVYEARGQYQLVAQVVQPRGFGDLQAKFEALKRKLDDEGLFDPDRKRPLPPFPRTIGIVTSPTGAAIRDILNVLGRRAPWVRVLVQPVRVQGEGAAEEIAEGITDLDRAEGIPRPDLVIVSRGGGSIEDLWAFNEEIVARAIADCTIPVMTGVGHEIDHTIADFVADRREPTPSAAAENATPDGESLERHLGAISSALESRVSSALSQARRTAGSLRRELDAREPRRRIQSWMQSLDYLGDRLDGAASVWVADRRSKCRALGRVLVSIHPERELNRAKESLGNLRRRYDALEEVRFREFRRNIDVLGELLQSMNPDAVVKRGFSLTLDGEGRPLVSIESVKSGERIHTKLADGEFTSI
jgi:exodeoxyribonuclease VII large subunit